MDGKKLFFLSLIVLSAVMGYDWAKNRSPAGNFNRPPVQAQSLINESLTIASESQQVVSASETKPVPPVSSSEITAVSTPTVEAPKLPEPDKTSPQTPQTAEPIQVASSSEEEKIFAAWSSLNKEMFKPSPFLKMIEDVKREKEEREEMEKAKAAHVVVKKVNARQKTILSAPFTATIETENSSVAIIDKSFYKVGQYYDGKKISEIKPSVIMLDDASTTYFIPKKGVQISISPDGDNVDVKDDFLKSKSFDGKSPEKPNSGPALVPVQIPSPNPNN
ncbi:MAG: hypothetical protein HQM08_00655 [Candidatus Riflebacteria bacterium]|nr:hypothetical protein [Candidatus Riflebacteria bacterium]